MENKIEVGLRYKWDNAEPGDYLTITELLPRNRFKFRCDDGYESDCYNDCVYDWKLISNTTSIKEESPITPSHYNSKSITPLQVIDSWNLDFYLGNTIKYIARYKDKGKPVEDLKKSLNYLQLFIEKLEKDGEGKD